MSQTVGEIVELVELFTVKLIVIVLSQPAAFGMIAVWVPLLVYTVPSGAVYVLQTVGEIVELVELFTVKLIVIVLSQPAAFGMIAVWVPLLV